MYCPNCGTENLADVKFCRSCGANLSLVPQALSGQLPTVSYDKRGRRRDRQPSMGTAIHSLFAGIGFILVSFGALFFAPAGRLFWFWMLIPAFGMLGKAFSDYYTAKQNQQNFPQPLNRQAIPPPPTPINMRPRNTGELVQPPPSVTESTTKLFDPPV